MDITFQKMHGTLNDFVVFDDLGDKVSLSPERARAICSRRGGVGADGIIAVRKSNVGDFFMDYVNADGSVAEMCGNGIRCLAKYVHDNGLTDKAALEIETRAGVKAVEIFPGNDARIERVRVNMGAPIFDASKIPVNLETDGAPLLDHVIEVGDRRFAAAIVSMGNPHCVIETAEDPEAMARRYGPAIENHQLFPAKTNVEFVKVVNRSRILMRVWERGSGETLACGTGACASAVAARLKGQVEEEMVVELAGGDLVIVWNGPPFPVYMTGPATMCYEGRLTI
jgi:diaminopimelate epimerase